MKTLSKLMLAILCSSLFISQVALADPIQDNHFQVHKAGWFKSSATPCPQVCKRIKGSIAEFEGFYAPQLKNKRTDLNYRLIRGNVDTRIKKMENGEYDAIILSKAGIDSLKINDKITEEFETDDLIPCAGQGIIAIQCKDNDVEIKKLLEKINDNHSRIRANTEREVLKTLEGDCDTAVGAFSNIDGNNISLSAELFSVDGKHRYFIKDTKDINLAKELGREVGEALKSQSKGSYKR